MSIAIWWYGWQNINEEHITMVFAVGDRAGSSYGQGEVIELSADKVLIRLDQPFIMNTSAVLGGRKDEINHVWISASGHAGEQAVIDSYTLG